MASLEARFDAHLGRYRAEIEKLRMSLLKRRLVRNPERLEALFKKAPTLASAECPLKSGEETFTWSYEVRDLAVALSGLRHPQPPGAKLSSNTGLLTSKVTEYFSPTRRFGIEGLMPIRGMEHSFVIEGTFSNSGCEHPLLACWHVDTHSLLDKSQDDCGGSDRKEAEREDNHALHPEFHYQFGGRGLRPSGESVRGVLMLDVPRIPVPPLDLNLAIDFVVTNYLGANWQHLRRDTQYSQPVRTSMRRIWAPYYACIAGHFAGDRVSSERARGYLPDLIKP